MFLFRKDINLAAAIQALETKNLLEMLAEPNVLAINGKPASFLAGGEFPFPMVQPAAPAWAPSRISFREYGVRLEFPARHHAARHHPPAGGAGGQLARLHQRRHVRGLHHSGADHARVQTEVELESGQSFVIAGLLDNQITESFSQGPGHRRHSAAGQAVPDRKRSNRNNTELLVIVTPEMVRPIPAGSRCRS